MKNKSFVFPSDITGYTSSTEGKLLYKLAQEKPHLGSVVELGTFHGRSAVCLAQGSQKVNGGKVFTIDNFIGDKLVGIRSDFYPEFKKNIERYKLEGQVAALRGDTVDAAKKWKKPVRLLFIDANHSYKAVESDFNAWEKYIVPGGIVAFHDSLGWWGVYLFVVWLILFGNFKNFKILKEDSTGIVYGVKKAKNEKVPWFYRYRTLLNFLFTSLPRIPALVRIHFSQRDESDFWYQFFDRLAKFYRKLERATKR